ncbi:MAG: ribosome biogenesis GTP-binding protein YihA/YsxC [Pseudomonadota bacterium]
MFAAPFSFVLSCHGVAQLPSDGRPEVAFAGRSNVGKSTLLNALVAQKGLAKASNTPGRTRALNVFSREDGVGPILVDMPGYGYARAAKTEIDTWTRLIFDYLRGRAVLRRVFLLVDARHGLKPSDEAAMAVLDEAAVSYQAVLTKCDKKAAGDAMASAVATALRKRPAAHPTILATSAETGAGLPELRQAIREATL